MVDLPPEVEQQLAGLSDGDWAALSAKVRAPDAAERFKTFASQIVSGDRLDALAGTVDLSRFVGDDGQIAEDKVIARLSALFAIGSRLGDAGRAEAARRFGAASSETPPASQPPTRGSVEDALQRRFGKKD